MEKKLQDKGWYNGKEDKCDDPVTQSPVGQSATSVDLPDVFTPGSSRFSAECDPSQPPNWAWTIVHKGERHVMHKLYPTVPGPHGNEWVSTILGVAESDPTGVYDRVNFFFSADIPSDVPGNHTIIHCNLDYHSYTWERRSWHDWIMVKWTTGLQVYEQAAHLLLIAHFMDTTNNWTKDVCAVNSLSGNKPKPDNLLPFFNGDTIEQVVHVVPAENILSEAYVCVAHY